MKRATLLVLLVLIAPVIDAKVESMAFAPPEQERRYKILVNELRCLVCQNQNIADSNADLAKDLRRQVKEMIERGDSDQSIVDFMVARYGDFVLYRPPFKGVTAFLWIGPFIFLAGGLIVMIVIILKRSRKAAPTLSDSDQVRVRKLLQEHKDR